MLKIFFTLLAIFIALMINEYLWRKKKIKNEVARKSIHISVAVFVAFWPYYLSYLYIEYIAIAFIVVIFISRMFGFFQSIEQVKRNTLGEYFFPLGILVAALMSPQKEIFTIALLCVGLADGLALVDENPAGELTHEYVDPPTAVVPIEIELPVQIEAFA